MAKRKKYWYEVYVSPIMAGESWATNRINKSKIRPKIRR